MVETLESLKTKGIAATIKSKSSDVKSKSSAGHAFAAETSVVTLSIISAFTLISLYALYKKRNIKLTVNSDGSITLETR